MAMGKISVIRGNDRYFSVALDEYDKMSMKGVMFQGTSQRGISFDSLLEMILNMDFLYDKAGCSKQTFQMRYFPSAKPYVAELNPGEEGQREGRLMTFGIYVRYRYHAGWQGDIFWEDGGRSESFESELQLIQLIDGIMNGCFLKDGEGNTLQTCHISIDTWESGRITGNYQNVTAEIVEHFEAPVDFAGTIARFMETELSENEAIRYGLNYNRLISSEACSLCRKGGQIATFSFKILFREYGNWQGIIYWREEKARQMFRSFKEMLYIIASALEAAETKNRAQLELEELPESALDPNSFPGTSGQAADHFFAVGS